MRLGSTLAWDDVRWPLYCAKTASRSSLNPPGSRGKAKNLLCRTRHVDIEMYNKGPSIYCLHVYIYIYIYIYAYIYIYIYLHMCYHLPYTHYPGTFITVSWEHLKGDQVFPNAMSWSSYISCLSADWQKPGWTHSWLSDYCCSRLRVCKSVYVVTAYAHFSICLKRKVIYTYVWAILTCLAWS